MENISNFLGAAQAMGVEPARCFDTLDLYEEKDLGKVIGTLHTLSGK